VHKSGSAAFRPNFFIVAGKNMAAAANNNNRQREREEREQDQLVDKTQIYKSGPAS